LLREYAVRRLLDGCRPGRFLEIGYGGGQMLLTLARLGFSGAGYDPSPDARRVAAGLLESEGINTVELLDQLPEHDRFDYLFLLEVLGYLDHPADELRRYSRMLLPGGMLVFSFVRERAGYSPEVVRDMRTFSAAEVDHLLTEASLRAKVKWNYGFPLANMMRPAMNAFHLARLRRPGTAGDGRLLTGLYHTAPWMDVVGGLINRITIWPWAALQMIFKNTNLGNGYVIAAEST